MNIRVAARVLTPDVARGGLLVLPSDFVPVDADFLDAGEAALCDLFLFRPPWSHVLFLAARSLMTGALKKDLHTSRVRRLYIRAGDSDLFSEHILGSLDRIVEERKAPCARKARVARQAVSFSLDRVFADPRAQTIGDLQRGVRTTTKLAMREPMAAIVLMRLTRLDTYTYNHSMNVGVFGTALALALGEHEAWTSSVIQGLFLHDIGKVRVPREVVNCPGKLSEEEWAQMRQHPDHGAAILQSCGEVDPILLNVVKQHHERHTGSGYPAGLSGAAIAYEATICAVADVFDALTTERCYRHALPTYAGLQTMVAEMRDDFAPEVLQAFVSLFQEHPPLLAKGGDTHRPRVAAG